MKIDIKKCPCGKCEDYHLVGIGTFVQGSGFTLEEATSIKNSLNGLTFNELMHNQANLQAAMGEPTGTGEQGVKESLLHVIVEATEALAEINFKPWKSKLKDVDREALATELTDILQFWANAANAFGFTPKELAQALRKKWAINYGRIQTGEVKHG